MGLGCVRKGTRMGQRCLGRGRAIGVGDEQQREKSKEGTRKEIDNEGYGGHGG